MRVQFCLLSIGIVALTGCSSGVNALNGRDLEQTCKEEIRQQLKDPNSMRMLSTKLSGPGEKDYYRNFVQVHYTAINGFGGRVRGGRGCFFNSEGKMTVAYNLHPNGEPKDLKNSNFIKYLSE